MFVTTAAEMRELDRATIEDIGIPGVVLMESAGRQTAEAIRAALGSRDASIGVLCGPGNNGGDGAVIARWLHGVGLDVRTFLFAPRDRVRGDALVNLQALERVGGPVVVVADEAALAAHIPWLTRCDVVVDALLGTGLTSDVRGLFAAVIGGLSGATGLRVAVDIPSGVDSDTGQVRGCALPADLTVTYGYSKHGHLHHPGAALAGRIIVADIGIPPAVVAAHPPRARVIEPVRLRAGLPAPQPSAHKGTYGHALVVAGSPGKSGAALLAGHAALRAGAGLVTIATDPQTQGRLEGRVPELMVEALGHGSSSDTIRSALALAEGKSALCVGPGLGAGPETAALVVALLEGATCPVVLDADGLNALVGRLDVLDRAPSSVVLTPHPGELARLLGSTAAAVNADRPAAARALAESHRVTVVLKGAHTVVASPDGCLAIATTGNPGMASGGTGDVLAGLIAGLTARLGDAALAAELGVWLHGTAGDLVAAAGSEEGLTAGALSDAIPRSFQELRRA